MSNIKIPEQQHIFISHAVQDGPAANAAYQFLTAKGLTCRLAKRNPDKEVNYGEVSIDGLKQARIYLLIFSAAANDDELIAKEAERAISGKLKIIVFRLEDIDPSGALEFFLSSVPWIDAFGKPLEASFEKLYQDCAAILKIDPEDASAGKRSQFLNPFFRKGRIRRLEYFFTYLICWSIFFWLMFVPKIQHYDDIELLSVNGAAVVLILLLLIWFFTAQSVKRCHDISRSGWYILNPVSIFLLPFAAGSPKKNKYGPSPKRKQVFRQKRSSWNLAVSAFVAAMIVCFSLALFPNGDLSAIQAPKGFRIFQTPHYYTAYPAGWRIDSSRSESNVYLISSPEKDSSLVFGEKISLSKQDYSGRNFKLDDYARYSEKEIKSGKFAEGSVLISSRRLQVGNRQCQHLVFTAQPKGYQRITGDAYTFIKGTSAYTILFFFDANRSQRNRAARKIVLDSFTLK